MVIHSFSGFISVVNDETATGKDPDAPYDPVQVEAVGSVMQLFRLVTSAVIDVQVVPSHLDAKVVGIVPALP